jgi:DNA-binding CsgD family transcriptional regulator
MSSGTMATVGEAALERRASQLWGAADHPRGLARRLELVYDAKESRGEESSRALREQLEVMARIRESMAALYHCGSPEQLIEAAPGELCRACGFSRALISRICGSHWVPQLLETVPRLDPEESAFREWVEQLEIPLDHVLLETELVRRRMPALVLDPANDPRTFREMVVRSRTRGYVAAPIISDNRAIGFLHADRFGQDTVVTEHDKDNIRTFAEHFASLFDRAVLLERLDAQRARLRAAFAEAEHVLDEVRGAEIEFGLREHTGAVLTSSRPRWFMASRLDALLTRREREVLELIADGATNISIAAQLVISEGTVKSHVKHILRKLHAGNRAEAVARYLQLLRHEQNRSRP